MRSVVFAKRHPLTTNFLLAFWRVLASYGHTRGSLLIATALVR